MARLRSGVGVEAFLRKQDPVPWHGNGPPSGEKCGRVKKATGPDINALQSPQSLQGSWGWESVRRAVGRRAQGGPGSVGRRLACREGRRSEESGRETGKPGRCSKWRWDRAAGRAKEELVAAMTAASGGAESRPGDLSPRPPSPFPVVQTPRKKGSFLLGFVYFKIEPSGPRGREMDGDCGWEREGTRRVCRPRSASATQTFDPSLWDLKPGQTFSKCRPTCLCQQLHLPSQYYLLFPTAPCSTTCKPGKREARIDLPHLPSGFFRERGDLKGPGKPSILRFI